MTRPDELFFQYQDSARELPEKRIQGQ
jgi:hypothetical protein